MGSPFRVDKERLIVAILDELGTRYRPHYLGWQTISCPNEGGHAHGDQNPSASLHLAGGRIHCHACDLSGDGFDLASMLWSLTARETLARFLPDASDTDHREEPTFIF